MDRILATALEIIDEQGADALSMRSLAQRLGSGTATLYRHFAGRAELVAMVVDRMLGEVKIDTAELSWQEACTSLARRMFDALERHGNLAPLLIGHVPTGPNALAQREFLLSVLLRNGFASVTAAHAYATLSRYVLGFAIQASRSAAAERDDADVSATFRDLDPAQYPATVAVADELPVPLAEEFNFGLQLIVAGLAQLRR
ncbi:TetR/AcrR family transcriptional regulator [Mycobacterium sp. 1423905.2]|uniref:TetR/AcrR family transcriptional regulator n=1 Tax=Mycobacterium sp. 1423905.2 TaxID=1856859 RepID=UPI00080195B7|nr:TetR/AcrR family transcriptional regulator [Mycobacterium sp. 1423905.2]OBJ54832.1 TetR family transcriptional regulator [Mycobacterium sp. 1423905.2]